MLDRPLTSPTSTLGVIVVHAAVIVAALGSASRRTAPVTPRPAFDRVAWFDPTPIRNDEPSGRPPMPEPAPWVDPPDVPIPLIDSTQGEIRSESLDWLETFRSDSSRWLNGTDTTGTRGAGYLVELPEILAAGTPRYPELLRLAGVAGRVLVEATIDTTGKSDPASLVVVASAHPAFNAPALAYVRGALFRPGRVDGRAIRVRVRVPVDFVLRR